MKITIFTDSPYGDPNGPIDNFFRSAADHEEDVLRFVRDNPSILPGMFVTIHRDDERAFPHLGHAVVLDIEYYQPEYRHYSTVFREDGKQFTIPSVKLLRYIPTAYEFIASQHNWALMAKAYQDHKKAPRATKQPLRVIK